MIIRFFYTILLGFIAPYFLYNLYKKKPGKPTFGPRWKEHWGIIPPLKTPERPVWIHAASVGEAMVAQKLIQQIKAVDAEQTILVTTTTSTGAEQIAKLGDLVEHRYMPLDFPFAVSRFLKTIKPSKLLIIETELWPNTIAQAKSQDVPVFIINARLSKKSCKNYQKIHPLFAEIESGISKILCQADTDKQHFLQLGVDEEKLAVTGSIKFDISVSEESQRQGQHLRTYLGDKNFVWIASSTHDGEDKILLDAHKELLISHPSAKLILVPRHPERFNDVYQLALNCGLTVERRTQSQSGATQVYLGDTMGEMLTLMSAADICFIGGSLLGDKVGGHNVIEPVACHLPTLIGPSYFNFKEITETLSRMGAVKIVANADELLQQLSSYATIGNQQIEFDFARFMLENSGATSKTLQQIF